MSKRCRCQTLWVYPQARLPAVVRAIASTCAVGAVIATSVAVTASQAQSATRPIGRALAARTFAAATPPVNLSPPTVQGTSQAGLQLTASSGSWDGSAPPSSFGFQWVRCDRLGAGCVAIGGAVSSVYVLSSLDVGSTVGVVVTGSNAGGSVSVSSVVSGVVAAASPVTGVLDDFNRPDGPLSGSWSSTGFVGNGLTSLSVVGQQVTAIANGVTGDFWNVQQFGPDSEVFVTVATRSPVLGDQFALALRMSSPASSSANGYQAYWYSGGAGVDQFKLFKRVSGVLVQLAAVSAPQLQSGDVLLFRAVGSSLSLWLGRAGVWSLVVGASDSSYAGAGYIALTGRNTTFRLDNYGGGTIP